MADEVCEPSASEMRMVIGASSLGTVFEWYDFFIWGTLTATGVLGRTFFPSGNENLATLLSWATFAIGFGFRPLGAVLFGYLGDRMGRKYTFLVTITVMGLATAGIGLIPGYREIGATAPIVILVLRIAQGLALGGEYGGAAIFVAEHSPEGKAGHYTSFIQASVVGGFILSLAVVLLFRFAASGVWESWGWRLPFLFSLLLLVISLWMRVRLSESPVFRAMKEAGETARNPFVESFTYPGNKKRLLVALFGIAGGLTVVWYTAMFSVLAFLSGPMRLDQTAAQLITGAGAVIGVGFFIWFGKLSDRVGRKPPIVIGYALTLVLLFPCFYVIGSAANPGLAKASKREPVIVAGPRCAYDPFATTQADECWRMLDHLSRLGVSYKTAEAPTVVVTIGGQVVESNDPKAVKAALEYAGYRFDRIVPEPIDIAMILVAMTVLMALCGATYGPVAALLSEMFPSRIRYSSMSIPYHIGTGYFGGFLPFISHYIVARTGNPYAGLWYTFAVVAMALVVTAFGLRETVALRAARR
ncbi:MFS transporter [Sphingomonas sp. ABOLD]|uniref:MFS family permease n=1 Tax=Sphingomonas trueperi TaxID=53317 RepID=A0A7X6BE62_9SPHN|nr:MULTISPECIES: MFS transporter [Sphingomonas]NJB99000.1 MFS family permease [Sphingomonas trueperi]RSV40179.1 MFS transporter [Sphingomonas sp. ABOLD]